MDKPILEICDLKKQYKIGQIGRQTLTADLQSWWAKVRKKEDPNSKIDQNTRLVGTTFMALNGINFTVNKGETVAIIGNNGAGKSTLLKLISRVTAPSEGEIVLRGRIASMLEVGTGFNMEMTGRENAYLNGGILGMTKAEIDKKMDAIIEFSEIADFIDTPAKRYSSGMYVKLAFSVAAHLDSEILVMDEVLAVGDVTFQQKCLKKMRDTARDEGRTILYVSHNMSTVRQLCDRAIVLKEGKVIFDGGVEEGIDIYSSNNANSITESKLLTRKFEKTEHSKLQMLSIHSEENRHAFTHGDTIKLVLKWRCLQDFEHACLNILVKDFSGLPIGCFESKSNIAGCAGQEYDTYITIPTTALIGLNFSLDMRFYQWDSQASLDLDSCESVFGFELTRYWNKENNHGWRKAWGIMNITDITVSTPQLEK